MLAHRIAVRAKVSEKSSHEPSRCLASATAINTAGTLVSAATVALILTIDSGCIKGLAASRA
jgi:hypothetical protein